MLDKQKYKMPLIPTSIRQQVDTDVFVIGDGLIGTLTTYFFHQNNVPCVLLELPSTHEETAVDLDIELTELSNNIDQTLTQDLFHSVLDSIYKLEAIMQVIEKDRCQYERNPQLHYLREEKDFMPGYTLESGMLVYQSGVKFNSRELKDQLIYRLMSDSVPILRESIDSIELDGGVTVYTPTMVIRAQKLVVTSQTAYQLFFPTSLDAHFDFDFETNYPSIYRYDPIRFFHMDPSIQNYFINFMDESNSIIEPLIGEDPLYPNVYFNVGNFHLLNGIIGSNFIRQLYLQSEISTIETIKFCNI